MEINLVEINGTAYKYGNEDDRLVSNDEHEKVRCIKCWCDQFKLNYGTYEVIAECSSCGFKFSAYSG